MTLLDTFTTTDHISSRAEIAGERDHETSRQLAGMGPICLFLCRLTVLLSPLMLLGTWLDAPWSVPRVLFLVPALGALLLAPREAVLRIQVSLSATVLLVWMALSYLWTIDEGETLLGIRQEIVPLLSLILVAGLLPVDETIRWWVRGMKVMLLLSVVAVVYEWSDAVAIVDGETQHGWTGWYYSKNEFGRGAVIALLTFMVLDKTSTSRWAAIALSAVFIVGSSSATALAAALVVVALVFWAQRYRQVGEDWSGTFLSVSIFLGVCGIIATYLAVEFVVTSLGRDITFTNRTAIWTASLDYLEREPWLGYGFGGLWDPDNQPTQQIWDQIGFAAANAHSGPLGVAVDVGLPGLALWFVLWLSTFTASLRLLRSHVFAVWAFAFLLIQLLVGVVEPVFLNDWLAPLLLSRILLSKISLDERRRKNDRDTMVDQITSSLDLDASWDRATLRH
jgi:exopolysaccharide production protein ExoQ